MTLPDAAASAAFPPGRESAPPRAVQASVASVDGGDRGALERAIEVGLVAPAGGSVRGVIIWCHGLGGSRADGAALSSVWAARGYCVILPTFADSIRLVVARHRELGRDPADPQLDEWALDPDLGAFMVHSMLEWPWRKDRVDVARRVLDSVPALVGDVAGVDASTTERVGFGGHSFGAYLTQLLAGVVIDGPAGERSFRDERVAAAVVASGQGRKQAGLRDGSWDRLELPLLNVTGTCDRGATTDDSRWKREPFELSPPGRKHQLVIDGADHGLGGVSGDSARFPANAAHLHLVEQFTAGFWDAYLGGDDETRRWLDSGAPAALLGATAEYSTR